MTEEREFYAATVDEALSKASEELGLPTPELSYNVMDEGASGFLGIGARDARILVETTVAAPEAQAEDPLATLADDEDDAEPSEFDASPETSPLAEVYGDSSDADHDEVPQELLDEVRDLVSSILVAMNFDARVEVYDAGGFIAVDV